jgi:hypothetical protein
VRGIVPSAAQRVNEPRTTGGRSSGAPTLLSDDRIGWTGGPQDVEYRLFSLDVGSSGEVTGGLLEPSP